MWHPETQGFQSMCSLFCVQSCSLVCSWQEKVFSVQPSCEFWYLHIPEFWEYEQFVWVGSILWRGLASISIIDIGVKNVVPRWYPVFVRPSNSVYRQRYISSTYLHFSFNFKFILVSSSEKSILAIAYSCISTHGTGRKGSGKEEWNEKRGKSEI